VPTAEIEWPGDLMANAAASLRCTAADYARFLCALMPGSAPAQLRAGSRRLHTTAQALTGDGGAKSLGWNVERTPRGAVVFHAGNNANQFRAFAIAEPEGGRALVVMTNGGGGDAVFRPLVRAALGHDLRGLAP
jgi:hypothetical protein